MQNLLIQTTPLRRAVLGLIICFCTYANQGHATINVLLANPQGIILVTDSRLTSLGAHGEVTGFSDTGQKLFQLDGGMVCSFAGTAQQPGLLENLTVRTGGVIRSVRESLATASQPLSFKEKADFVVDAILNHYAIWFDTMEGHLASTQPGRQEIQILLAGYDSNGQAKIAKAVVVVDGARATPTVDIQTIGDDLRYLTAGADDTTQARLRYPRLYADDPALKGYAEAQKEGRSGQLSVPQLQALAEDLKTSAAASNHGIGGHTQLAVLQGDRAILKAIPGLIVPPLPKPLTIVKSASFGNSEFPVLRSSEPTDYIDSNCDHSAVVLDRNTFYGGFYDHCAFFYNGGPHPSFDKVSLHKGSLVLGPDIQADNPRVTSILEEQPALTLEPVNTPAALRR